MILQLRPGPIGQLVALGITDAAMRQAVLTSDAAHILWLAPDDDDNQTLQAALEARQDVSVVYKAIAPQSGTTTMSQVNLAKLAGLPDTPYLRQRYPGLVFSAPVNIETISPSELLDRVDPDDLSAVLVIGQLGCDRAVLHDLLTGHNDRPRFSDVYVSACKDPDLSSTDTPQVVTAVFEDYGYRCHAALGDDAGFPLLHFQEAGTTRKLQDTRLALQQALRARDAACADAQRYAQAAQARTDRLLELSREFKEIEAKLAAAETTTSAPVKPRNTRTAKSALRPDAG